MLATPGAKCACPSASAGTSNKNSTKFFKNRHFIMMFLLEVAECGCRSAGRRPYGRAGRFEWNGSSWFLEEQLPDCRSRQFRSVAGSHGPKHVTVENRVIGTARIDSSRAAGWEVAARYSLGIRDSVRSLVQARG